MSNITDELKRALDNLKNSIKDKDDLDLVKTEIFNLYNTFLDEISKMTDLANNRIAELAESQNVMLSRLEKIESGLNSIKKDIYMDEEDDEDYDLSITCPYCNKDFVVDAEDLKDEITCPECNNVIELDWGDGCSDEDCGCCNHHCHHDEDDDM